MKDEFKGHTPGPWCAEYVKELKTVLIGTEDRRTAFARMEEHAGDPDSVTQACNARLIAAAPALLAENRRLRTILTEVLKFKEGVGKYNFTTLTDEDRENAYWDRWYEIENNIRAALTTSEEV